MVRGSLEMDKISNLTYTIPEACALSQPKQGETETLQICLGFVG